MEVVFGIYVVVGLFRAIATWADSNPARKPLWMLTEENPLTWAALFSLYVLGWPLIKRR